MATSKTDDRRRPERVASRIREELAMALGRDLGDPRLANVVISNVHVTDDLSLASVSLVAMGDDAESTRASAAVKVLARMEGGLRKRMAPRLGLRRVPSLRFEVDRGRGEVERLDALLHEVATELNRKGS
jgi:ribosome-binding factor A